MTKLSMTNTVKNSHKSKHQYSNYGIAFEGAGSWSLAMTLLGML